MRCAVAAGHGVRWGLASAVVVAWLAGSALPAHAGIFGSPPPVPDWVKAAEATPLPHYPESTRAVVLLDDTTYTVGVDGQAVVHVRHVVKILRPQGRKYGMPVVWYDKDSKVLSMHVWSVDAAGHEYSMKDSEITDYSPPGEGGQLYEDEKAKVASPPGVDAGAIVAYEYEKRERPYLAETSWSFQSQIPRLSQRFTLALPVGFNYATTWANHPVVDGADLENHSYRWEMDNEPAIDLEDVPMSPSTQSMEARLTVHYSGPGLAQPQDGTWQGVGQWYNGLSHDRVVATPDIAAKAAELVAGKTDFYDKAEAIGEFVQKQIRYFVVEMGIGGFQPHYADDIFRGRYGDCKDKATLLTSMLSSVGLHGGYLLVDTERGVINPTDPSITANHMIGVIEIPEGYQSAKMHSVVTAKNGKRYLIFDPTWDQTPFGQVESNLQGSYALMIDGKYSELIQIPILNPELNTIRRSATLELTADGSLKGTVVDERFGDIASYRREMWTHLDQKEQQQYMDHIVGADLSAASLTDLKVQNVDALNQDLKTSFTLNASHFASATGPLLMVRPRVFGSYALHVNRKKRKVAIDLERTMQGTDEFDIQIPDGYVVDELPDPVKADYGFASYVSSTELRGKKLHYTRTFTLRDVTVPADKYADVQNLADAIAADEDSRAVLKKGN